MKRELDFLIAEKVMRESTETVSEYTSDINAAMQVGDRFKRFQITKNGTAYSDDERYRGAVLGEFGTCEAFAPTASLALCLAALKAVGAEIT